MSISQESKTPTIAFASNEFVNYYYYYRRHWLDMEKRNALTTLTENRFQ